MTIGRAHRAVGEWGFGASILFKIAEDIRVPSSYFTFYPLGRSSPSLCGRRRPSPPSQRCKQAGRRGGGVHADSPHVGAATSHLLQRHPALRPLPLHRRRPGLSDYSPPTLKHGRAGSHTTGLHLHSRTRVCITQAPRPVSGRHAAAAPDSPRGAPSQPSAPASTPRALWVTPGSVPPAEPSVASAHL